VSANVETRRLNETPPNFVIYHNDYYLSFELRIWEVSVGNSAVNSPTIIIRILAEGGSLTLFGLKDSQNAWHFCRSVNDQTPTFLAPEEGGGQAVQHSSGWVNTWPEAMALLDRYPWATLAGREVHPEFQQQVWAEVSQRLKDQEGPHLQRALARWKQAMTCMDGEINADKH
jgi:hypothetical protein